MARRFLCRGQLEGDRVRSTLNLGLRYELPTVPYTVNGYARVLNASQTALLPCNVPAPGFGLIN